MIDKNNVLHDRRIAILATDGVDQTQLLSPIKVLENAGAKVVIVSINEGDIKTWDKDHWGRTIHVDETVGHSTSEEFDALIIPGSEMNPSALSLNKNAVAFVKDFVNEGKMVASICHGTQVLIESGLTKGRTLTTWPSLKKNLINSGATWRDEEVVAHKGIVSSRCPHDNAIFNKKIIEGISISPHSRKNYHN
jgi:protease I